MGFRPTYRKPAVIGRPLAWYARFFFYGLHGFFDEIAFTAVYDFVFLKPDVKLIGYTSLYTFVIYGLFSMIAERLYINMWYKHRVSIVIRMISYLAIGYTWEFCWGLILRQFDACSWDYSDIPLNVMGLITFSYAPFWLLLSAYQEWVFEFIFKLRVILPSVPLSVREKLLLFRVGNEPMAEDDIIKDHDD
uniref:Transmembrane protein 229A-like n=1 Tax=Saccoglossus kowalevskii TaxID=10224 RepID=A0ABM0MMI8_SACKO|nr:PREDICTED: transmembrane protein 229A-like [Saccoglossus kowalevskii]